MSKFIDLTGEEFGRLKVLKRADDYISPGGTKMIQWLCECSCQDKTIVTVIGNNLKKKNGTRSCGCLNKEIVSQNSKAINKKYNRYNLSGEYGIGYDSKNREFYFDLEDYELIKDYYWYIDNKSSYVQTTVDKHKVLMHRLILNCSTDKNVDHKHGRLTRNDNRKENLRVCTTQENGMNVGVRSNNTSGCTGVVWNKRVCKWMANIKYNNKRIHLGYFIDFNDAVQARKWAENIYFGEWSYDNSQENGNNK